MGLDSEDEESKAPLVAGRAEDAPFQTLDEAIAAMGFGRFQRHVFLLCGMGLFVEAIETSFHGVLLPILKAGNMTNRALTVDLQEYWHLNNYAMSAM